MVSVIQSFGDRINPNPHVHAIASRGGWTREGRFIPIPYVDPHAAQELFRHEVLTFLQRKELVSEQRVELLLSWRHSGFSVHNTVHVSPGDQTALEALVRYLMRPPVSLARLQLLPGRDEVLHFPKGNGDDPASATPERIDSMEYVARVLAQIPPGATRPPTSSTTPPIRSQHPPPPTPPCASVGQTCSGASTKSILSSVLAVPAA